MTIYGFIVAITVDFVQFLVGKYPDSVKDKDSCKLSFAYCVQG